MLPKALTGLINALEELPGVGPRTAERYAYFLYKSQKATADTLAVYLKDVRENIKVCPVTYELIDKDEDVSPIYADKERDRKLIAVVEDVFDVVALENTKAFNGTYHVLGGLISPIDNITPETLHIPELIERIKKDKATEIIIAANASIEGESTAHYIQKQLEGTKVKVTRLAQGLPIGLDIEYADQITLSRALEGRRAV
ncbi:MAG TPA: recombination mediator RecR [Candidatus Saccharimonadales bacterium]|nr:recombination mediator RecR [Candidatus Saccharimonadales bacterium]